VNLRSLSPFQLALAASVALHGALLTIRFVDPTAFERAFQDTPLEVILVNARTNERPEKAQAIAQATMAGGGDATRGRATSPLAPTMDAKSVEDLQDSTERSLQSLQAQQNLLLSQVKNQLNTQPTPTPEPNQSLDQVQREEKRRQLVRVLAEIEKRINADNSRPRKRYVSPATKEAVYALYYDQLRRSVEDKGTRQFPESGGSKLYGELTMILTVNALGHLLGTEIVESSGNRVLDRQAEAIARAAAPFGPFSAAMRRNADQILVVSRFRFTRDETLQAGVSTP
jgi:periplasmic protein TonB